MRKIKLRKMLNISETEAFNQYFSPRNKTTRNMNGSDAQMKASSRYLSNLRKPKVFQSRTRNASKAFIQVSNGRDLNMDSDEDSLEDAKKVKIPPFIANESSVDQFSVENTMNQTGAQMSQRHFTLD